QGDVLQTDLQSIGEAHHFYEIGAVPLACGLIAPKHYPFAVSAAHAQPRLDNRREDGDSVGGAQHALELFRVWLLGHLFQDGGGFFQDFPGKLSRGGKTAEQEDQNQRQTQYSLHPFHFLSRVDTLLGQPFPEYTWEGKGAQACPVCTFSSCPRVWAGVF